MDVGFPTKTVEVGSGREVVDGMVKSLFGSGLNDGGILVVVSFSSAVELCGITDGDNFV